jgi:hypothetical protein
LNLRGSHTNIDRSRYEFNDATISEIEEEDVGKAYGGSASNTRGGYSWQSFSSASAYMLMYRRKDDALNITGVEKDDLPAGAKTSCVCCAMPSCTAKQIFAQAREKYGKS